MSYYNTMDLQRGPTAPASQTETGTFREKNVTLAITFLN